MSLPLQLVLKVFDVWWMWKISCLEISQNIVNFFQKKNYSKLELFGNDLKTSVLDWDVSLQVYVVVLGIHLRGEK